MTDRPRILAESAPRFTAAIVSLLSAILAAFALLLAGAVLYGFGLVVPATVAMPAWVFLTGYFAARLVIRWIERIP